MPEYPCTLWHCNLGVGDGQDMASRGYLRSLLDREYKNVVISPRGSTINHFNDPELEPFREIFGFPEKFRAKIKRVEAGDPRIGTQWKNQEPQTFPPPVHAPKNSATITWDAKAAVGDVDQDYYEEHPDELGTKWSPKNELLVLHYDPGQLARSRDALMREGADIPIVGITAWEPDRIPQAIAQQLSDLDLLIVPSAHTARAFCKSGLDPECPLRVVPHTLGIEPLTSAEANNASLSKRNRYGFYTIGTDIPRKNLRGLVAAYFKAFAPNFDLVSLLIKTSGEDKVLQQLVREGYEQSGVGRIKSRPNISLYGQRWEAQKIRALHNQGHCWVDAGRGEGFGLGQIEAAAMGNPVITTGWGAAPEHLSQPGVMVTSIPYTLTGVDPEMAKIGVYREDQQWADPDLDALADAMRSAALERRAKSLSQARLIGETFSLREVGRKLSQALDSAKEG